MNSTKCPLCKTEILKSSRYPKRLCCECSDKTYTAKDEKIDFYNEGITGGFYSLVNNVKGEIHECYVNNIKCYAEEGRFGGIIIQTI